MVSYSDILIHLLISILCFSVTIIIMRGDYLSFLFFIPIVFGFLIHTLLKRRKKIAIYLKDEFQKLGYNVLSERPLRLSETKFEVKPAILINGVPASRYGYLRQFTRVFEVINEAHERFELNTVVTNHWNGKKTIDIINTTKLD